MSIVSTLAPLFAPNAHAIRYFDEKRNKWSYRKIGRPLEEADLTRHVSKGDPEFSLGAYVLRDLENSRGHALIFDFDDHVGNAGSTITEAAVKFVHILEELQLPYLIFRSGGGQGFHFYLLFEESQPKSWLRALGKHLVCEKLRLTEGTNGVKADEVEIFPKSDRPGGENVIALPLARKSVALRREGDHFVEAPEPTEIPYCPVLTQIEDPGYGSAKPSIDHRREFLAELIGYADRSAYAVLQPPAGDLEARWQRVTEPLTLAVMSDPERIVAAYFPVEDGTEKTRILVIMTTNPKAISVALGDTSHFVVSSACSPAFFVWCIFAKPRRRDQLRKIANDATKKSDDGAARVFVGGENPAEIPLCGTSKFITTFDGENPVFGPAPLTLPINYDRPPGPKKKAADRDQAFECLVSRLDAASYDQWVKCGHLLIATFGKEEPWAFESWCNWSQTAANADSPEELRKKWDRNLVSKPKYSPASFWLAAKEAGYDGPLPFGKSEERKFRCVDLASGIEVFRSQEEVSFATIGPRHHVDVRSRAFEQFLRLQTFDTAGELMSVEDLKAVVETIDAQCQKDGKRVPVYLRVARHGDKGYLFLGDDDRTVIEFDANGFRECPEPPVCFRRPSGAKPSPKPVQGVMDELRQLFNLEDDDWVMLVAWLVMTLVHPGRPMPICVLNGEHGSAKTTALKQVVAIIDPKVGATAGPPKTEDDLIASAYSSYIVSFDNVTSFSALSDPLCRLATGGGLRKRQLYSDNSLVAYDVIRPVIVSGIDPTAYNLDIVERLFTIELTRPDVYLTEEEVTARFDAALPSVLGALLAFAGKVAAMVPGIKITVPLRMADFARVGEAVAQLLDHKPGWFSEAYLEMLESAAADNSEGDPVFNFVEGELTQRFAKKMGIRIGDDIKLKASELHARMMSDQREGTLMANREDVPRNARLFSSRLFRIRKQLEEAGFTTEKMKSDRSWRFEIASQESLQAIINMQAKTAKAQADYNNVPF